MGPIENFTHYHFFQRVGPGDLPPKNASNYRKMFICSYLGLKVPKSTIKPTVEFLKIVSLFFFDYSVSAYF